ncbi:glycoside hydrolase family 9 protein [Crepidotus variabilis]|uniref:Endoglucanase n=1 Tax=Crepidotus variabilis TaxID=179855 RepID=A0A9P6ET46_9AGAR|nr:glycoside hydrolase family 9 protein [Crepidotus variabilis]
MWGTKRFLVAFQAVSSTLVANAQLTLPNTTFLPPNISTGAQPSSGGSPNPKWSSLLGNLLYFYDEQRSGTLPSTNRVPWRNDSLIDEGRDQGMDLSGGYYDAGDYSKFTFPLSFALMSICWGATDFGKGYDLANQTAYLDATLRWGLDWLIKAHPDDNTLVVMIEAQHDNYWGGDRSIPSPRPVYKITAAQPGTDAAAGAAAAFAACSNLYANRAFAHTSFNAPASLKNESYADTLLSHGKSLYSFAVNATGGRKTYQTSVPQVESAYGSSAYGDELSMAALFLAFATNQQSYYQDAETDYTKYDLAHNNRVFNWDSKTPGVAVLFSQVLQANSGLGGNFSTWQQKAEDYFDNILNNGEYTDDGLLYYDGDSDDASLNPALNVAMLMERFAPIASSRDKTSSYTSFAKRQIDYVLGKNSMNVPYIVGLNPNSPRNPHSAMASGGFDVGKIDTDPVNEAYVLYGAVVGGPDKRGRFFDIRSDWSQTEVALDYNAPMLTLAASHVITESSDPFYITLQAGAYDKVKPQGHPCDAVFRDGCNGGNLGKNVIIAMAVILTVVGLVVLGLSVWYILLLKRSRQEKMA